MTMRQMQDEILRLKRENDVCILAHAYQSEAVLEIADHVGDSFGLSQEAAKAPQQTILMCGVRFMAETAKLLSPEKRVLLSHAEAGCPMANQITREDVLRLRAQYPGYTVVSYINTTAEVKAVSDVCVTSSSAVKIVRRIENDKILFLPDPNLGAYVAKQLPEKEFALIRGGCPAHQSITVEDVLRGKQAHPDAPVLVHPESDPDVCELADFLGSTTEIMAFAKASDKKAFLIGTENSIVEHLQYACPDKQFYPLSKTCICQDMKLTTLTEILAAVQPQGGCEIRLPDAVQRDARRAIDEMLRLGQ